MANRMCWVCGARPGREEDAWLCEVCLQEGMDRLITVLREVKDE